jgi:hypothetical protein
MSRFTHFLDNRLTGGGEVVSLTRWPRFTPRKIVQILISVRARVNPRAMVWREGVGKFQVKSYDHIGNRTHDHPACSIVPQPTMI